MPHPPLIIPGVGKGSEIPDTRTAFNKIAAEIEELNPETIIIISPHSVLYSDYFHISPGKQAKGDMSKFEAKQISFCVSYDEEFAELIGKIANNKGLPAGPLGEREAALDHGVMVPSYFIAATPHKDGICPSASFRQTTKTKHCVRGCTTPPKPFLLSEQKSIENPNTPSVRCCLHRQIVRISLSGSSVIEHYRLGMCIAEAGKRLNRKFVVIASGDMSHKLKHDGPYGFAPEGPEFDKLVCYCIENNEWQILMQIDPDLAESAAECGYKSIGILLGVFDGQKINGKILCYEGPFGVGYLTAEFEATGNKASLLQELLSASKNAIEQIRAQEDEYVRLARQSVEYFTRTGEILNISKDLPKNLLNTRAGVFVSVKKEGNLRGCVGTTGPSEKNIAAEIIQNAISACSRDPRFSPVEEKELPYLIYSVDVLFPPEAIKSKSKLDVNRYGVIVRCGRRSGLLLPALAGINTVDEQISIALRKGGISPDEPYTLERFEVVRHN